MTHILKQQETTHMPPPSIALTPLARDPVRTQLLKSATELDYRTALLHCVAIVNIAILVALLWMFLVPESSMGVLAPLQAATHAPREVIIALFLCLAGADVSQGGRAVQPKYAALTALSTQGVLFLVSVWGLLFGGLSLISVFNYGGVFLMSLVGTLTAIQFKYPVQKYRARVLMMPLLSTLLWALAWGLVSRPDTGITRFIGDTKGVVFFVVMMVLIVWGWGQLRHDHLTAWSMMRRCMGLYLYAFLSLALLAEDNTVSVLGVCMTIFVACFSILFAGIQAQPDARPDAAGETDDAS